MSRHLWGMACGIFVIIMLVTGCNQGTPTIGINQIVLCRAVGPNQDPLGETDTFAPTSVIYCSVQISNLAAGTVLTARWYYGGQLVANSTTSYTITPTEWSQNQEAVGYITFRFEPSDPLPEGAYHVEISMNERLVRQVPFRVVAQ
ncbi:MAG: hypothetical protein KKA73_17390 [Chloroflexi bacterium]|nr:hypothetical protein [Chloroflexota bacterium]MBU1749461.1 hypothetical protein [Chloroflexota bacterium]